MSATILFFLSCGRSQPFLFLYLYYITRFSVCQEFFLIFFIFFGSVLRSCLSLSCNLIILLKREKVNPFLKEFFVVSRRSTSNSYQKKKRDLIPFQFQQIILINCLKIKKTLLCNSIVIGFKILSDNHT